MADLKKREKRRANRTRKNQQAELIAKEDEQETPLDEEVPEVEIIGKDYYEGDLSALTGPTSWEEVDAMKDARHKANEVSEATYTVQDLVYNIARNPVMSPDEKGKAIGKVGSGFGKRVKEIVGETMEKEVDMELLQLQAILATDSRHTSVVEKATDFLAKSFGKVKPDSKLFLRMIIKNTIESLESGEEDSQAASGHLSRENIPSLIQKAKEAGIGVSSSIMIEKDVSGNWRAVLFPTNNFKDRDGEIITNAAHLENVEWMQKNMDCAPAFATWHKPGTRRENFMDFVGYENGIMITSLPLTQNEAARFLKMQAQVDIGLSIGGIALQREGNIITKYRIFEVSDLPLERAANPFTEIELISKEAQMDMKKYLSDMLGDETRADAILKKMELTQKQLRDSGVEEKEVKTPDAPAAPVTPVANTQPVDVKELVDRLSKELGMKELSETIASLMETAEKVPVLEALVKELAETKDDELAKKISPKAGDSLVWMKSRASQSQETVLDPKKKEDEKLQKSVPTGGWLAEALSVEPVNR